MTPHLSRYSRRAPRLKDDNTRLRERLADLDRPNTELTGFKTTAISDWLVNMPRSPAYAPRWPPGTTFAPYLCRFRPHPTRHPHRSDHRHASTRFTTTCASVTSSVTMTR